MVSKKIIYGSLSLVLSGLRWAIWIAVGANIAIEIREVYLHKDVHHLALSAIFFLLANIQIGISRLLVSMNDEQASRKFFHISIFMICAAIINLVDLNLIVSCLVLPIKILSMCTGFYLLWNLCSERYP